MWDFYFERKKKLMKNFSARRHISTQQPRLPGQHNDDDYEEKDDDDDDDEVEDHDDNAADDYISDDDDDDDANQVDGAQKQLVGSLGAIERMLGIITEKLQVAIAQYTSSFSIFVAHNLYHFISIHKTYVHPI